SDFGLTADSGFCGLRIPDGRTFAILDPRSASIRCPQLIRSPKCRWSALRNWKVGSALVFSPFSEKEALLLPPLCNLRVVPGQQNLRNRQAAKIRRPRV